MSYQDYDIHETNLRDRRVRFSDGEPNIDSQVGYHYDAVYDDVPDRPRPFRRESDLCSEDIGTPFPNRSSAQYEASGGRHSDDPLTPRRCRLLGLEYGEEPISTMSNVHEGQVEEAIERQKLPGAVAREQPSLSAMSLEELELYLKCLNEVHEPSMIREGLYVANYESACYYLSGQGNRTRHYPQIGYVLSIISFQPDEDCMFDALEPSDRDEFPDHTRLLLNVRDSTQTNLMEFFPLIVSFIVHALENEARLRPEERRGILIHCRKGMSRSVAAVMAYLIWAEDRSVIEIWRQVKLARIVSWPNPEFYTQLVMWKMLNCSLTDEQGRASLEYQEYVVSKDLRSAMEGVKADLTAHLIPRVLQPPAPWSM